jgi:dinuclear metal center YbgI/SA1388 family protein
MVKLQQLVDYCDQLLDVGSYQDYCPNGLQIEGRSEVRRIISGVSASQALLDAAVAREGDLVLVHHGYFWKGEPQTLHGMRKQRIKTLLCNDISLLAYHLPLDGHVELGNNAQLARRWGFQVEGRFGAGPAGGIAMFGTLAQPLRAVELAAQLSADLSREALLIEGGERIIRRLGWCSGAAQDYLEQAAGLGLDAFISGEVSERTVHSARELGIHYIAAGHHATERYGVEALGAHLAEVFSIENQFLDLHNPA